MIGPERQLPERAQSLVEQEKTSEIELRRLMEQLRSYMTRYYVPLSIARQQERVIADRLRREAMQRIDDSA